MKNSLTATVCLVLLLCCTPAFGQNTTSYTSNTANSTWNSGRWNNSTDGPTYSSGYIVNRNVVFTKTDRDYEFIGGMGGSISVGNITVLNDVSVVFSGSITGTLGTGGNVRTFDVGDNAVLNFSTQVFSNTAGTGFIKDGNGTLALSGTTSTYSGGFTLNAGTVVALNRDALGSGASNTLTLNGGILATRVNGDFSNRFGGGIIIGGDFQVGQLPSLNSLATGLGTTFNNNVTLGHETRTITIGNNGIHDFKGIVSNSGIGGITVTANANANGSVSFSNESNTFSGTISALGGEIRFARDGTMGNVHNTVVIDGGRFVIAGNSTYTISDSRNFYLGDTSGSSFSIERATSTVAYNGVIADIAGKSGVLNKVGEGTLVLGGNNTYTGATSVTEGTLVVNGTHSGMGGYSITGNGTLSGSGTIASAIVVDHGGKLNTGSGIGTLTVNNNVSLGAAEWKIDVGVPSSSDSLDMSSGMHQLSLTGETGLSIVNFNNGFAHTATSYTIASLSGNAHDLLQIDGNNIAAGSVITTFTSMGGNAGTNDGLVHLNLSGFSLADGDRFVLRRDAAGDLVLDFKPIPEPGTMFAIGAGVLGGGVFLRRSLNRGVRKSMLTRQWGVS